MKRIIEIEEKDYDQICEVVNETESTLGITPFAGSIIAQSKPYDDSGDLISREALRNIMKCNLRSWGAQGVLIDEVMETIDNAQTVEPICPCLSDNEVKQPCLNSPCARPQGEWEDYSADFYKCPECGYLLNKLCPQCQNKVILPKGGAE